MMPELGVNIDHVATVRNARGGQEPDPVAAAVLVELAGAQGITVHLREDRRHIRERDLRLLRQVVTTRINLEMACTDPILRMALEVLPEQVTLVPEKREEVTTEGGLDVRSARRELERGIPMLREKIPLVSLFLDPDETQIRAAVEVGANMVELHTGRYAESTGSQQESELELLRSSASLAAELGLKVAAGHGLNYRNVGPVAALPQVEELNIGHSIVGRAVMVGMDAAVREMLALIRTARPGRRDG